MNIRVLIGIARKTLELLPKFGWVALLLTRLFVGYFFLETGWGKLHNLDGFAMRFAQWGIPHPAFNAALSAYTEFIGGALTIAGLGTRLVSIPMIINMIVAIVAVNIKSVSSLNDFVELDEPLYALSFLWLFFFGPGFVSMDAFVKSIFDSFADSRQDYERRLPSEATANANP